MIGIIKGDVRYTYLSQIMKNSILSNKLEDFYEIDILVLPLGGINSDYIIKQTNINIKDILDNNRIKLIFTGNANNELADLCDKRGIRLYTMLNEAEFVIDNAYLTAKGSIHLIHDGITDLSDKNILILGYGHIGYYLAKLLKKQKIKFDIFTYNSLESKYVALEGHKNIDKIDKCYDIIINTIPKNLDNDYSIFKNSIIYELASEPYGFDINQIDKYKLDYRILSGVPSKYAPRSAALIIKKFIENKLFSCM